jgi:hypothetical protein
MSRYILIRRLRGPVILLLMGTLALLHQMGVIPYFWRLFWPLLLITVGLLLLAERAALAAEGYPLFPGAPWQDAAQGPGQAGPNQAGPNQTGPIQGAQSQGSENSGAIEDPAIVPSQWQEFQKDREGGQS